MKAFLIFLSALSYFQSLATPSNRWQQRADYHMKIDFDVNKHQFNGVQTIIYTNNSPDTLHRIYYHLYFNAFQPNSMMDVRSRTIKDPDRRVRDRISKLNPDEIGYHKIDELKQDGQDLSYEVVGTILEVNLAQPVMPKSKTKLRMKFNSQVPLQVRRSGRNNAEGIDYSMAQWYPKLCEYDYQGWHANPYVGREFYGIWGDFKVDIEIDDSYTLAGSGILTNAKKIGRGYSDKEAKVKGKKVLWMFEAENVHDFVWAADPDYKVLSKQTDAGTTIYYVYQPNERTTENWKNLHRAMNVAEQYMNKRYGKYPYPVYSFIQGGDGGMEYPMATLITGERSYGSLVGVSVHEWMHSWYQMVLGTNESLYPWMDEGFTSFGSSEVMNQLRTENILPGDVAEHHPNEGNVKGYINFTTTSLEEPLSTHADHFTTNAAYGRGSYTKGAVFLTQLQYIMGEDAFTQGLRTYFETWKFKHPNVNDFIRVMEKSSDLELDWFKEYFVNTTHTIDYAIDRITAGESENSSIVNLVKLGVMPMPVDLSIELSNGQVVNYTIPLRIMRGEKSKEGYTNYELAKDWPWTHANYSLEVPYAPEDIATIVIDKSMRLADVNRDNNSL